MSVKNNGPKLFHSRVHIFLLQPSQWKPLDFDFSIFDEVKPWLGVAISKAMFKFRHFLYLTWSNFKKNILFRKWMCARARVCVLNLQTLPIRAKCIWRIISLFENILEGSVKAQNEGLDVNFHNVSKKIFVFILH